MHRIDTDTAGPNANGDGKSGFIKGSAPTGVKSTRFSPPWCNALQEEICHVIEAAGGALDKADNTQLATAIAVMISASSSPDYKAPVRAATTGAVGALTGLLTIDGVVLVAGDRVLVKDQAAGAENGIYVAAAGAWARAGDAIQGKIDSGALVPVKEGVQAADTLWMLKTDGAVDIGTTAVAFSRVGGDGLPLGSVIMHSGTAAPAGYLIANGAAVARATYTALDAAMYVGDAANATAPAWYRCTDAGNPTGTRAIAGAYLVLPDYRGVVLRGLDLGRGLDPDSATRVVNGYQADAFGSHAHTFKATTNTGATGALPDVLKSPGALGLGATNETNLFTIITQTTGGTETRGKNTAVLICVKSFSAYTNQGLIDITQLANDVAGKVAATAFTGANQSLAANGYQKLPGGLIVQWGSGTVSGGDGTITFPITFPAACLSVYLTGNNGAGSVGYFLNTSIPTVSGCAVAEYSASFSKSGTNPYRFLAIGY